MASDPHRAGALRTGFSAGTAFAGGFAIGVVVAAVALAAFVVYLPRLNGATGWWPWLLAALLLALVPLYVFLGVNLGRGRAVARVVQRYGEGLAERMAQALAQRIEAMPRMHGALHKSADLLSTDELLKQLEPWTGHGRAVRFVVSTLLQRLPLADVMQAWQNARAEQAAAQPDPAMPLAVSSETAQASEGDPALRRLLTQQIHQAMADFAQPSALWLWLAAGVNAVALLAGFWITTV